MANERLRSSATGAGAIRIGDIEVERLGFGAMRITGPGIWGPPRDRDGCLALLKRAVEGGVNFIDTADSYGPHVSEELIAEALHPYPDGLVIASKGGLVRPGPSSWQPNCHPRHLRQACEASLKRLRLDCITLYQLHTVDPRVPLEDLLGELVRLQQEGKIRYIGVSNEGADQLRRARRVATIVSVQNCYNIGDRADDEIVDICARERMAFIPWAPLGSGRLAATARKHNATPAQVALAWLLARSPAMLPIPGTSSIAHFDENMQAANIRLSESELREIALG